jgi:hypothetical protein
MKCLKRGNRKDHNQHPNQPMKARQGLVDPTEDALTLEESATENPEHVHERTNGR